MMRNYLLFGFATLCLLKVASCGDSASYQEAETYETVSTKADMEQIMKKGVIYEVNIRQFTPEGTFNAFSDHLPRLAEMGVDIIWLMPIHPIGEKERKGELGSYYSVRDYKAVNPEFGTEDDLRNLIGKAHDLGMIVILDWVPNHTAWDAVWTETNPEFYVQENGSFIIPPDTDWTDVIQLDYDNPEMRRAMKDAMIFWLEEYDIDGFRCDVAGFVPNDFWEDAIAELRAVKSIFMLAEWEDPEHHNVGFDMSYAWELHHIMNQLAQREATMADLMEYNEKEQEQFPEDAIRMVFIDNHDENSWNGTIEERMGDNADAMAVFSFTFPGMPLIYTGQEAALDFRLPFFEKSEVPWGAFPLQDFYTDLVRLKKENPALWNQPHGGGIKFFNQGEHLIAFSRSSDNNEVLALLNLDQNPAQFSLEHSPGLGVEWFSQEEVSLSEGDIVDLNPGDFRVFTFNHHH